MTNSTTTDDNELRARKPRAQRMTAAELKARFQELSSEIHRQGDKLAAANAKLDKILFHLELTTTTAERTHGHDNHGDLTFIKGTGSLIGHGLGPAALAALQHLEADADA